MVSQLRVKKLENAIGYFAKRHYERTGKPLTKIFLYKYLAFLDFMSVKETGRPAIGLKYIAMKYGPVPIDLHREVEQTEGTKMGRCYKFVREQEFGKENIIYIYPLEGTEPDLRYFSPYEIKLMERLVEIFADRFVGARIVSEASHQAIKAWKKAFGKKPNSLMRYEDELEGEKDKEVKEERLQTYKLLMGE